MYDALLYAALFPTGLLLAQTEGSDAWVDSLLKGGPFAIVLLLIIMDKIGTHGERDRLRVENTELRKEVATLNEQVRTQVVPPLVEITRLLPRVIDELTSRRGT